MTIATTGEDRDLSEGKIDAGQENNVRQTHVDVMTLFPPSGAALFVFMGMVSWRVFKDDEVS